MYSIANTLDQDGIFEAAFLARSEPADHELPEPLEHWSLEDFEDLTAGKSS